jgi:molybdate transport system ATP-binding protein
MTLEVAVRHRQGDFLLDAAFEAGAGVTALFGPSGAGKTTIFRAIAGLIRPDEGRIALGGEVLTCAARRIFVPPHRRSIGVVFQETRLFPHLSARDNLLYGARARAAPDFARIVDLLGIGPLLDRAPATLSGGERSRVAIGRALLSSPRLLLMDEPLASLDDARKREILPYLERLARFSSVPILYVSHAFSEVARLADAIALIDRGRIVRTGSLREVAASADLWQAGDRAETGVVIEMKVAAQEPEFGLTRLSSDIGELRVEAPAARVGSHIRVRIPARDVLLATEAPQGLSAQNVLSGEVLSLGPEHGAAQDVRVDCGDCRAPDAALGPRPRARPGAPRIRHRQERRARSVLRLVRPRGRAG